MLTRLKQIYASKKDDLQLLALQVAEDSGLYLLRKAWQEEALKNIAPEVHQIAGLNLDNRVLSFPEPITWIVTTPVIEGGFYKANYFRYDLGRSIRYHLRR